MSPGKFCCGLKKMRVPGNNSVLSRFVKTGREAPSQIGRRNFMKNFGSIHIGSEALHNSYTAVAAMLKIPIGERRNKFLACGRINLFEAIFDLFYGFAAYGIGIEGIECALLNKTEGK